MNTPTTVKWTAKKTPQPWSAANGFQRRHLLKLGKSKGNRYEPSLSDAQHPTQRKGMWVLYR